MCGIFGVHGNSDAVHLAQLGLYSLQHRGQESVGVAVFDKESGARVVRSMGTISPNMASELDTLHGQMAIGHTRYSTAGSSTIENAQPVFVRSRGGYIALAHNGNLTNAGEMRQELEAQGSIFASTMDSEVLVHRLAIILCRVHDAPPMTLRRRASPRIQSFSTLSRLRPIR